MARDWAQWVYKSMVLGHGCVVLGVPNEFDEIAVQIHAALADPETPDASGRLHPMRAAHVRFTDLAGGDWEQHAQRLISDLRDHEVLIVILDEPYHGGWPDTFFKVLGDEFSRMGGLPLPNGVYLPEGTKCPLGTAVITSSEILRALDAEDRGTLLELYSTVEAELSHSHASGGDRGRASTSGASRGAANSARNERPHRPGAPENSEGECLSMVSGVSNEAVDAFANRLDACMERIGGGKVQVDTGALRALVREEPKTAVRVAEIYCLMGESNPAYFQGAMTIASAYYVEFKDDSVLKLVQERARRGGGEEALARIETEETMIPPEKAKEARAGAAEWWRRTGRQEGLCDNCAEPLRRGEGYLVRGPVYQVDMPGGPRTIDAGEEIICEQCWRRTHGGERWG